jgi:phosphatidate phosphatase PAH1
MVKGSKGSSRSRVVRLKVNSREVSLQMKLGPAGEAFFVERTREDRTSKKLSLHNHDVITIVQATKLGADDENAEVRR